MDKNKLYSYWLVIFYKAVFIKKPDHKGFNEGTGFYVKKRIFVWLMVFPFLFAFRMFVNLFLELINTFQDVFSYENRWITLSNSKKTKLSFNEQRVLVYHFKK